MHWKRLATFVLPASWLTTASAALYALVLLLTDWRPAATLAPGVPGWAMTWLAATVLINLAYFLLASGFVARIGGRIVAGVRGIGKRRSRRPQEVGAAVRRVWSSTSGCNAESRLSVACSP